MIYLSATQIELWGGEYLSGGCQRKWAFKYVEKISTPKHPAAALGTEVQDTQIDPWLDSGQLPDFSRPSGEIAQALIPLLPPPKSPGLQLRRKFVMASGRGPWSYRGEFDLYAPDAAVVPGLAAEGYGCAPLLGDIKTTGNLAYAKTKEKLLKDIQSNMYAANLMFDNDCLDTLDAVWFYTRTKGKPKAQREHVRMTSSRVYEEFAKIEAVAADVYAASVAQPKAMDLPPNVRMCDAFGGCPYRHVCNLSPAVQSAAVNQEAIKMGNTFLDNLRKQTTPIVSAQQGPSEAELAEGRARYAAALAAEEAKKQLELIPAAFLSKEEYKGVRHVAVNPPETALPPAPPAGAAAAPAPIEKEKAKRAVKAKPEAGNYVEFLASLVVEMKAHGIKRIEFTGGEITAVELA